MAAMAPSSTVSPQHEGMFQLLKSSNPRSTEAGPPQVDQAWVHVPGLAVSLSAPHGVVLFSFLVALCHFKLTKSRATSMCALNSRDLIHKLTRTLANDRFPHLILSSERVERLEESCWMSDSSTGWLRGHGC